MKRIFMPGLEFDPLTSQHGIAGTMYSLQLGLINSKWAVRLLIGKETKAAGVINEHSLLEKIPTPESIVRWALRVIVIPNINPYQIRNTALILHKEAKINKDKKKLIAPIKEAKDVHLDSVPKSELKVVKPIGWVVQDKPINSTKEIRTELQGSEICICTSCRQLINYCPNCGTNFNKSC
jgi:hypothetical protein